MNRQRLLPAAALLAVVSVLLTGCGGGDDGDGDSGSGSGKKVAGADVGSPKASESPSPTASASDPKAPDLSLPKDVKVVADWREPADKEQVQVLRAAANFMVGLNRAIVQQDAKDPAYLYYSYPQGQTRQSSQKNVQEHVDKKYSVTGTERMTRPSVKIVHSGSTAVVSFCVDDTNFYTKDLKTGKPMLTKPSADDHTKFEFGMIGSGEAGGVWRAREVRADVGAQECQ